MQKVKSFLAWVGFAALVIVGLFIARDVWARQGGSPGDWVNTVKPKPAVVGYRRGSKYLSIFKIRR